MRTAAAPTVAGCVTYYLYDDLGHLRCVVQPEGVRLLEVNGLTFTDNILKEQSVRYEYDSRNSMIIKQVPVVGPIYMVYDKKDRLVMTLDANQRLTHKWLSVMPPLSTMSAI